MKLLKALLSELFGSSQAGGHTMGVNISLVSSTLCSHVSRFSTAGGDETHVSFDPPLSIEEALLHARKYTEKGRFEHK